MVYYALKVLISAVLIVAVAEIGKRSSLVGGFLASLPLISILAFVWLYHDTRSVERVASLSANIFWLVLPSLSLFIALPWLLKKTGSFYASLGGSLLVMFALYSVMMVLLKRFQVDL